MSHDAPSPAALSATPRSARTSVPFADRFMLMWVLFQLTLWTMDALWLNPRLLDHVGLADLAIWIERHGWMRWVVAPPLGLLTLLSSFTPRNTASQRAAGHALATRLGATVEERRKIDPGYGLPLGPAYRIPLGKDSMSIGWWSGMDHDAHSVARVFVEVRDAFGFASRAASQDPILLRGMHQQFVRLGLEKAAEQSPDPRAHAAAAAMAYLSNPPLVTGNDWLDRTIVLRANQVGGAIAMFTTPGLLSAVEQLDVRTQRWEWTLTPSTRAGLAELRLVLPGSRRDEESIRMTADMMQAGLDAMASAGLACGSAW